MKMNFIIKYPKNSSKTKNDCIYMKEIYAISLLYLGGQTKC